MFDTKPMSSVLEKLTESAERERKMTGYTLTSEKGLDIRLHAVEYPADGASATVAFEVYAKQQGSNEHEQRISLIRYSVPFNGKSGDDYEQIVRTAANSLTRDLVTMQGTVSTRYIGRVTG